MISDEEYIAQIATMSALELLGEVLANPSYLTDSYYTAFGRAISARYQQLLGSAK
jgi:hypothetical protein